MRKRLAVIVISLVLLLCSCTEVSPDTGTQKPDTASDITASDSSEDTTEGTTPSTDTSPGDTGDAVTDAPTDAGTEGEGSGNQPHEPVTDSIRLVMVGDVLMHDPVIESGRTASGYSFAHLFEKLAYYIESADIAMLNQEVIIAGEGHGISGYPWFNSPFELADAIAEAGFDVALHATNHTLDKGKDAMLDCLEYWESNYPDVEIAGMHDSFDDADRISIIERGGIKVAVLNYTYGVNSAGKKALDADPYLVDILEEERVRADCAAARASADLVTVAVHWGDEYSHTPSSSQRKWANVFLECGVDLVIGTHPHVLQPVEWIEDSDGNRMLVYWSLGNYVNATAERGSGKGARLLGAMACVDIAMGDTGKAYIRSASAMPLITHIEPGYGGIAVYSFENYDTDLFEKNDLKKIDPSADYAYCYGIFDRMLGQFWGRLG